MWVDLSPVFFNLLWEKKLNIFENINAANVREWGIGSNFRSDFRNLKFDFQISKTNARRARKHRESDPDPTLFTHTLASVFLMQEFELVVLKFKPQRHLDILEGTKRPGFTEPQLSNPDRPSQNVPVKKSMSQLTCSYWPYTFLYIAAQAILRMDFCLKMKANSVSIFRADRESLEFMFQHLLHFLSSIGFVFHECSFLSLAFQFTCKLF